MRIKKILMFLFILGIIVLLKPLPVQAKTSNSKIHKKYQNKMESIYNKFDSHYFSTKVKLMYAYADLNGDEIDELLVFDANNTFRHGEVYTVKNGKVKCLLDEISLYIDKEAGNIFFDLEYYESEKLLSCRFRDDFGHIIYLYSWNGKKYKEIARKVIDQGPDEDWLYYYVNGKETTEEKYNSFVKKKTENAKVNKASNLKWYEYDGNDPLIRLAKRINKEGQLDVEQGSQLTISIGNGIDSSDTTISVSNSSIAEVSKNGFDEIFINTKKTGTTKVTVKNSNAKVSFNLNVVKKGTDSSIGSYGDLNSVVLARAGKLFFANVGIYRLASFELYGNMNSKGELVLKGTDPSGGTIEFLGKKMDNKYILTVTNSGWNYLKNGDAFETD